MPNHPSGNYETSGPHLEEHDEKERKAYEVVVENRKLVYRQNGVLVNTVVGSKWIFVLSTTRTLYVGQKQKGLFQHSSFLSGGAITAAGRLVAHEDVLEDLPLLYMLMMCTFGNPMIAIAKDSHNIWFSRRFETGSPMCV